MSIIEIIIFGVLQGIAEFLPISSSGHIVVLQRFLTNVPNDLSLNIAVHLGTLLTIFLYYRREWKSLAVGIFRLDPIAVDEFKLIVAATIPTGIIGLGIKKMGASLLSSVFLAGCCFFITGWVLFSEKWIHANRKSTKKISIFQALVLGVVQGIAVLPGLSRSGLTIVSGLWLGIDKEKSARLSFFISVPAILGAALLEYFDGASQIDWIYLLASAGVSFFVGLGAITLVVWLTKKNRLSQFSWYLWPLGALVVTLSIWRF